jgi:hypothetical protein
MLWVKSINNSNGPKLLSMAGVRWVDGEVFICIITLYRKRCGLQSSAQRQGKKSMVNWDLIQEIALLN